jgi:hypothetical protein
MELKKFNDKYSGSIVGLLKIILKLGIGNGSMSDNFFWHKFTYSIL